MKLQAAFQNCYITCFLQQTVERPPMHWFILHMPPASRARSDGSQKCGNQPRSPAWVTGSHALRPSSAASQSHIGRKVGEGVEHSCSGVSISIGILTASDASPGCHGMLISGGLLFWFMFLCSPVEVKTFSCPMLRCNGLSSSVAKGLGTFIKTKN